MIVVQLKEGENIERSLEKNLNVNMKKNWRGKRTSRPSGLYKAFGKKSANQNNTPFMYSKCNKMKNNFLIFVVTSIQG